MKSVTKIRVSVCVPSYNYAHFLGGCLSSVLAQSGGDFELIVVDDCSTDGSEEVIRSFDDSRLRYLQNETHLGHIRTWNSLLSLARGEYVCFLCADDLFLPRKLEVQAALLDDNPPVGLVHSDGHSIDAAGELISPFRSRFPPDLEAYLALDHVRRGRQEFRRLAAGYNYVHLSNAMFRRASLDEVGAFDQAFPYAADWDLWLRLLLKYDVAYVAEPLSCIRWHDDNLTAKMKQSGQAYVDWYGVIEAAWARWPGPKGEMRRARRQALRVVHDHLLPTIHQDYAQGHMAQARWKIRLAVKNDPLLLTDGLTVATYLKSLPGKDVVARLRKLRRSVVRKTMVS